MKKCHTILNISQVDNDKSQERMNDGRPFHPATINGSDTEWVTFYCVRGQTKDIFSFPLVLLMKTSFLVCFLCRVHSMSHPKPGYDSMLTSQENHENFAACRIGLKSQKKAGTPTPIYVGLYGIRSDFQWPKSVSYGQNRFPTALCDHVCACF